MKSNKYCVIMAGGIGSRFWPISRKSTPKQFLDILGNGKSLIRSTYERFVNIIDTENFLVVTNEAYKSLVKREIPELDDSQILCEPFGRNTAPCIAYAAFHLKAINPQAEMIVTPSDHIITNEMHFCEVMLQSLDFIKEHSDAMVTVGLQPTRPDTGYGYIQIAENCGHKLFKAKTFTEKPKLELAEIFIRSGEFFWNSGIFIWKANTIIDAMRLHVPDIYELFASVENSFNTPREQAAIKNIYTECRAISIDFGVMERCDNVYVRCSDFGWSDIGTWGSLYQQLNKDERANTSGEKLYMFDTHNCMVKMPKGKVAVIDGLDNYIVVDTDDALLICPRENEQDIIKYIENIKFDNGIKYI
ncbi:MAG: mannose-1-phosphate guanylyltransferase [Tidjanibacter sp.]|nr:mannose-1-phosphate guanylyltransferase [Tidjanibacter sp.]